MAACQARAGSPLAPLPTAAALAILSHGYAELLPVRDREGCAVVLLRNAALASELAARYGTPALLQAVLWLLLEAAKDSDETQLCGVTLLEDMDGYTPLRRIGWLLHPRLLQAKLAMRVAFPRRAPFRLGALCAYNVPRGPLARCGWGVGRLLAPRGTAFARRGARDELERLVLARFDARSTLPRALGGPLRHNFGEWLRAKAAQLPGGGDAILAGAYAGVPTSAEDASYAPYEPPRARGA